jgi:hypothetical protein
MRKVKFQPQTTLQLSFHNKLKSVITAILSMMRELCKCTPIFETHNLFSYSLVTNETAVDNDRDPAPDWFDLNPADAAEHYNHWDLFEFRHRSEY